ncbi:MAG: cyclase family protein [Solirubrobacteraceae bacterium]
MSWWGRWGEEDQRGAANLVDAAATARGVASVRTGEVLSLAVPMRGGGGTPTVGRPPMGHFMLRDGGDYAAGRPENGGFGFADDYVTLATHGSTHIDALSHVWRDGRMYNGFPADRVTSRGAGVCGIEAVGPLVTRAILVDLVGDGPPLEPGERVSVDRLASAVREDAAPGDALLVRTGWTDGWLAGDADVGRWAGLDRDCVDWIVQREFAVVAADNVAVEAFPSSDADCQVPLHVALLRDHGIYFCELLDLRALAATRRTSFMLVLAPLPLVGAVGSPVNPVAVL